MYSNRAVLCTLLTLIEVLNGISMLIQSILVSFAIRPRPIMLKILPIMLLSSAQKSSLLCSKLCSQNQHFAQEQTVLLK